MKANKIISLAMFGILFTVAISSTAGCSGNGKKTIDADVVL